MKDANYKIDDKALQGLYQELAFNIASCTDVYCRCDLEQLWKSDFEIFLPLTLKPDRYLRDKKTQPSILKSLIMNLLVEAVFTVGSDPEMPWASEYAPQMRKLYLALLPGTYT